MQVHYGTSSCNTPVTRGGRSGAARRPPLEFTSFSLPGREVRPAVLLPALLGGLGTLRPFLAVADGLLPVRRDSRVHQKLLGGRGALVAESEVVLGRSPLVAVPLNHHGEVGILSENPLQ